MRKYNAIYLPDLSRLICWGMVLPFLLTFIAHKEELRNCEARDTLKHQLPGTQIQKRQDKIALGTECRSLTCSHTNTFNTSIFLTTAAFVCVSEQNQSHAEWLFISAGGMQHRLFSACFCCKSPEISEFTKLPHERNKTCSDSVLVSVPTL